MLDVELTDIDQPDFPTRWLDGPASNSNGLWMPMPAFGDPTLLTPSYPLSPG